MVLSRDRHRVALAINSVSTPADGTSLTLVDVGTGTSAAAYEGKDAERVITFLWVDEIRGSQQWLKDHPEDAKRVLAMRSLDLTGQDTAQTGGTFLIEKSPDPSALWERPWDPHLVPPPIGHRLGTD